MQVSAHFQIQLFHIKSGLNTSLLHNCWNKTTLRGNASGEKSLVRHTREGVSVLLFLLPGQERWREWAFWYMDGLPLVFVGVLLFSSIVDRLLPCIWGCFLDRLLGIVKGIFAPPLLVHHVWELGFLSSGLPLIPSWSWGCSSSAKGILRLCCPILLG